MHGNELMAKKCELKLWKRKRKRGTKKRVSFH